LLLKGGSPSGDKIIEPIVEFPNDDIPDTQDAR